MANYWEEVHVSVLNAFKNCFTLFRISYNGLINDLPNLDGNPDAIIDSDYLTSVSAHVARATQYWESITEEQRAFYKRYWQHFRSQFPERDWDVLASELKGMERIASEQVEDGEAFDRRHLAALDAMDDLLHGIEGFINCQVINVGTFNPQYLVKNKKIPWINHLRISDDVMYELSNALIEHFFDEDGINEAKVRQVLFGEGAHLSQVSLDVMARVFIDPRVDYYTLANIGILNLVELEESASNELNMPNAQLAFERISKRITEMLIEKGVALLYQYSFNDIPTADKERLASILRRAQLLGFRSVEYEIIGFDEDLFIRGSEEQGGIIYPHIMHNGEAFIISDLNALFGEGIAYTSFHIYASALRDLQARIAAGDSDFKVAVSLTWSIAKKIAKKHPALAAAMIISSIASVQDNIKMTDLAVNLAISMIQRDPNIPEAQRQEMIDAILYGVQRMGGGAAMIQLPNGEMMVLGVNLSTPQAYVRFNGLYNFNEEWSPDRVMEIWNTMDPERRCIRDYLRGNEHRDYRRALIEDLVDPVVREQLEKEFPHLNIGVDIDHIPLEALTFLMQLER